MTAGVLTDSLVAVLPGDVDDPTRPSGGNRYDQRLVAELRNRGWRVGWQPVTGAWPRPDEAARTELSAVLGKAPTAVTILLDGLVACAAPGVVLATAADQRFVVLVHQPLGFVDASAATSEAAVLRAADAVIATSEWSAQWLRTVYGLGNVHVATPGTDAAPIAAGSKSSNRLLCVASVVPAKGHDVLVDALSRMPDLEWTCDLVGSVDRMPGYVEVVSRQIADAGLAERVAIRGALTGADLDAAYHEADLFVLPTRAETWGMVVTEALARAMPVVVSEVGGVPEALGSTAHGLPGVLVPPADPIGLGQGLRRWLTDLDLRTRTRDAAAVRRGELSDWARTADVVVRVLREVAA